MNIQSDEIFWRKLPSDFDFEEFLVQFDHQDISQATTHSIALKFFCAEVKKGTFGNLQTDDQNYGGIFKFEYDGDGNLLAYILFRGRVYYFY